MKERGIYPESEGKALAKKVRNLALSSGRVATFEDTVRYSMFSRPQIGSVNQRVICFYDAATNDRTLLFEEHYPFNPKNQTFSIHSQSIIFDPGGYSDEVVTIFELQSFEDYKRKYLCTDKTMFIPETLSEVLYPPVSNVISRKLGIENYRQWSQSLNAIDLERDALPFLI